MSALVPAEDIERIVGARRHPEAHLGRAVSSEQVVYILHSVACRDSGIDLRECIYSRALDLGIEPDEWEQDTAQTLQIDDGWLCPDNEAPVDIESLS